jgi:predicted DNA binding CopG/RHH family protein
MKKKAVQKFTQERLAQDAKLSPAEIVRFLEEFANVVTGDEGKRKLISLRVPERLLRQFKHKALKEGTRYQTRIVELMRAYLQNQ